jgi:hypothetical protein
MTAGESLNIFDTLRVLNSFILLLRCEPVLIVDVVSNMIDRFDELFELNCWFGG